MVKSPAILVYLYFLLYKVSSGQPTKPCGHHVAHILTSTRNNNNYGILGHSLGWKFASEDLKDYIRKVPLLCENMSKISCMYSDEYLKRDSVCLNYTLSELRWSKKFIVSSNNTCENTLCFVQPDPKRIQMVYERYHTITDHPKVWSKFKIWASKFVLKSLPDPSVFNLSVKYFGADEAEIWMRVLQIKATLTNRYQNSMGSKKPTEKTKTFYLPLNYLEDTIIINFGVEHF